MVTEEFRELCRRFLNQFLTAAMSSSQWEAGAFEWRDAVKAAGLVGSHLASRGLSASWLVLVLAMLADSLERMEGSSQVGTLRFLMELAAAGAESHHLTLVENRRDQWQKTLRHQTPLVRLTDELPALFVVDHPDRQVWAELLDRLLTEAVRTGSTAMVVDFEHAEVSKEMLAEFHLWTSNRHASKRTVYVTGLDQALVEGIRNVSWKPSLAEAVSAACGGDLRRPKSIGRPPGPRT